MKITQHAQIRSQQRGIAPMVIDLLLKFGSEEPAGNGARKVYFDKQARRRLNAYAGTAASHLNEFLDIYAVVGANGQIITTSYRNKHITRV